MNEHLTISAGGVCPTAHRLPGLCSFKARVAWLEAARLRAWLQPGGRWPTTGRVA